MRSFTYMSGAGIDAVADALPERFPVELNNADARMLVEALSEAYHYGEHVDPSGDCGPHACAVCWAGDFVSSVAGTVGVEFV